MAASGRRAIIAALVLLFVCIPVATAFSSPHHSRSVLFNPTRASVYTKYRQSDATSRLLSKKDYLFNPTRASVYTNYRQSDATSRLLSKKDYEAHHLFPDFFPQVGISPADKALLVAMSVATTLAFAALMSVSGLGAWRYFLAGGICAATSHAITTPIDVVKVSP